MSKRVKQLIMQEMSEKLAEARDFVVVDSSRLDGVEANRLRLALREKNIQAFTVRNSLVQRTLGEAGVTGLETVFTGPSTLVWGGEDIVALSKEIAKWAKELSELEIKGGVTEGSALSAAEVDSLSKSPGRLELIGQIAGLMLSPGARLAGALLGPGGKLAGQVNSIAEKEE